MLNKKRIHEKLMEMGMLFLLVALLLSGCSTAQPKVYHVGLLSGVSAFNTVFDGFKARMAELGYEEGKNITYDLQVADGNYDKIAQLAQKFVADKVDLIVTTTNLGAKAAKEATTGTNIPVVFTIVTDVPSAGLVQSVSQPGGNVTGISQPPLSYLGKRVEYIVQIVPTVKRLWIFYDPDYTLAKSSVPVVQQAAAALGLELVETYVKSDAEAQSEMDRRAALDDPGIDAILLMPDLINSNVAQSAVDFANKLGIPVGANVSPQVNLGCLVAYASDNIQTGQLAAAQADKILKGTNPGDLPVETADLFLIINLKAAQTLGITIPDDVVRQADTVVR